MFQGVTWPKKQQKAITADVKLDAVRCIESGECIADVGRLLAISESTVRTIRNIATKT
jgi:hypothetical protein